MTTMMKRTVLTAALLGVGSVALAMPGGSHRHADGADKAGMRAGCGEVMAMKDGEHRGHGMMGGMQHRHGEGTMQHRHGPNQPVPADKAPPSKP
jgi:hypothetical protein